MVYSLGKYRYVTNLTTTLTLNNYIDTLNSVVQTFRNYREMFEEQKAAIEQRYRHLLEDSIQDAVFLSARNNELVTENQEQRQRKYTVVAAFTCSNNSF